MRESPRLRRLRSDHRGLIQLRSESTILDFQVEGQPPERYILRFRGVGLWRPQPKELRQFERSARRAGGPISEFTEAGVALRNEHEVRVTLGASYPRMMPSLSWLTPIFHPNISESGIVCLGGYGTHWVPSLNLAELCEMLWDMIRYQNLDVDSPYNRDAAIWVRAHTYIRFPLDARPLRDRVAAGRVSAARPPMTRPAPADEPGDGVLILDESAEVMEAELLDSDDQDILFLD